MKLLLPLALLLMLPLAAAAQSLDDYRWQSRLLFVFTPTVDDPLFVEQYTLLKEANDALQQRRLKIMLVTPNGERSNTGIFLSESNSQYYYDYFSVEPFQLEVILVGLDGTEKFRAKNTVTPVSVLLQLIDEMPMRQREIIQGYGNDSQIHQAESPKPNGGGK